MHGFCVCVLFPKHGQDIVAVIMLYIGSNSFINTYNTKLKMMEALIRKKKPRNLHGKLNKSVV